MRGDVVAFTGPGHARLRLREEAELTRQRPALAVYGRIWREAAEAAGASVQDRGDGSFELRRGAARARVRLHATELDGDAALRLALDRRASAQRLADAGVAIPEQRSFTLADRRPAAELMARHGAIVVKPASGTSGGDGVTSGVRTPGELARAAVRAARAGAALVAERHVTGDELRLLFLDGELLDAVLRRPPSVVGDGRSSLGELLARENRARLDAHGADGLKLVTIDLDAVLTLRRAGRTLRTVPARGERVVLKGLASQAGRRDSERADPGALPAGLVDAARAAGAALGLRLFGVDVLGEAIVEVNGTPGLHYHEHVPERASPPVAVPVLEALLT